MFKKAILAAALVCAPITAQATTAAFDFTASVTGAQGAGTIIGPLFDAFSGLTTTGTTITGQVSYDPTEAGAPSRSDNSRTQIGIGLSVDAPAFNTFMTGMTQVGSTTLRSVSSIDQNDVGFHELVFSATFERLEPVVRSAQTRFTAQMELQFNYLQRNLLYPINTLPADLSALSWDSIVLRLIIAEDSTALPPQRALAPEGAVFAAISATTPVGTGVLTADVTSITPATVVPVPASLPLLFGALAGLGVLARRRRAA